MHSFASQSKRDNGGASWVRTLRQGATHMAGIGIDIGSTATKAVVADPSGVIAFNLVIPTGFSRVEVAEQVRCALACEGFEA